MLLGWVCRVCGWEDLAQMFSRVTRATGSVAQQAQIWQGHFSPVFSLEPCFGTEWIPERGCKWQLHWKSCRSFWNTMVTFHKGPRCQEWAGGSQPWGRLQHSFHTFWCRAVAIWTACWEGCERHFPTLDYREDPMVLSDTSLFIFFWYKKDKPSPPSRTSQMLVNSVVSSCNRAPWDDSSVFMSHFRMMHTQFYPQVDFRHNWAFTCREENLGDIAPEI